MCKLVVTFNCKSRCVNWWSLLIVNQEGGTWVKGLSIFTDVKDNLGNIYDHGFSGGGEDCWQTYYINGKYSKLKGKYILTYNNRGTKDESRFKIYGDGKLIYSSPIMTGGVHPIDFEVDITGVLELKVEMHSLDSSIYHYTMLVDVGLYQ